MDEVRKLLDSDAGDLELQPTFHLPAKIEIIDELPEQEAGDEEVTPAAIQNMAQSVRAAFLSGKSIPEIKAFARGLPMLTWLDYFIKLQPKEVQVKGQFDIRQLTAHMGPVKRKAEVE